MAINLVPELMTCPFSGHTMRRVTTPRGGRHYVVVDHEELPPDRALASVTTLTGLLAKPGLAAWEAKLTRESYTDELRRIAGRGDEITPAAINPSKMEDRVRDSVRAKKSAAPDLGERMHKLIEDIAGGGEPDVDSDLVAPYKAWRMFMEDYRAEIIFSEVPVFHPDLGYAGTIDAVLRIGDSDDLVLADWKTSARIHPDYGPQLAGYSMAVERLTGDKLNAMVVRLDKDAPMDDPFYEARWVDLDESGKQFMALWALNGTVDKEMYIR